ncbi:MAG: phospholipase [Balneolaceae bacterium]|nr:MAG: phospholipase [Balneolaceae bacterium]
MFKANKENPFQGPHQNMSIVTAGRKPAQADAAMVLIHGRGATADSILTLANEFDNADQLHLVAPQASQFTWYPYSFLAPTEKNEPGLSSGLQVIFDIITSLESEGIPAHKIILLGFSQGACLASEFVARHPAKYGGLIALSGGLIGDVISPENFSGSLEGTPYFVGCSDIDAHIPVERVHDSAAVMEKLGASVLKKIYPGMGHTVNEDEISEAKKIIDRVLSGK